LRQFIFDDINQDQAYQIQAGTNEGYNEVWWFYPSANSTVNNKYVIYNHLERVWYYGTITRTAWLDSPLRQYPMGAFSVQNSYLATAISTTTQTSITLLNGYSYPASGTVTIDSEDITYTAHDANDGNTLINCTRGANSTTAATHTQYAAVTYKAPNQVCIMSMELTTVRCRLCNRLRLISSRRTLTLGTVIILGLCGGCCLT
jgi:hypothetical protein